MCILKPVVPLISPIVEKRCNTFVQWFVEVESAGPRAALARPGGVHVSGDAFSVNGTAQLACRVWKRTREGIRPTWSPRLGKMNRVVLTGCSKGISSGKSVVRRRRNCYCFHPPWYLGVTVLVDVMIAAALAGEQTAVVDNNHLNTICFVDW